MFTLVWECKRACFFLSNIQYVHNIHSLQSSMCNSSCTLLCARSLGAWDTSARRTTKVNNNLFSPRRCVRRSQLASIAGAYWRSTSAVIPTPGGAFLAPEARPSSRLWRHDPDLTCVTSGVTLVKKSTIHFIRDYNVWELIIVLFILHLTLGSSYF